MELAPRNDKIITILLDLQTKLPDSKTSPLIKQNITV